VWYVKQMGLEVSGATRGLPASACDAPITDAPADKQLVPPAGIAIANLTARLKPLELHLLQERGRIEKAWPKKKI